MVSPHVTSSQPRPLLRYRNRDIREFELKFIRSVITRHGAHPCPLRTAIARDICRAWDWRQANGRLAVYACGDLLLRLEQWGHIELPKRARARSERPSRPVLPDVLIPLAWTEVRDADVELDSLVVRPITPEERLGWRLFMGRYHYLGCRPIVGEHILYAAFLDDWKLVALLGWASAAFRAPLRERYVGWDEETKRRRLHLVVNNVRFLIPRWVRVRHLASKVLAYNLRRLSSDWQEAWGHPIYLAETFVDTARFRGTCYRASNWIYLGHTAGRSKRGNAYLTNGAPKALYVYELHCHARKLLCQQERA